MEDDGGGNWDGRIGVWNGGDNRNNRVQHEKDQ